MNERELLIKRFSELAGRAYGSGIYTFTDFLGLDEQSAFTEAMENSRAVKYTAFGGVSGAERIMVRFGDEDELGYTVDFPIVCIKAEPVSQKFADKLTHRDFLGALLNLGIERSTLGDIPIIDNVGYIFAKEDIAEFICSSLTRVKHTDVRLSTVDSLPEGELYKTERRCVLVSGERLDAVIAKLHNLSRDAAQSLFFRRLVYVNGRLTESVSYTPKENDKISVRGYGRFIYIGCVGTSKKGRLNIALDVYV